MGGLGRHEAGLEPGAGLDGGPGQAFGEGVLVAGPGHHRPRDQQLGAAAAAHEPQRRHFQGVVLAAGTDGLDHLGQRPGNGLLAECADAGAHHVPVDGVGQADLDPAALRAAGDQPLVFEGVDRCVDRPSWASSAGPSGSPRASSSSTDRSDCAQVAQAQRHQLDQPDRGRQHALKTPQAPRVDEGPGLERTVDQLPQEHRVPTAARRRALALSPHPPVPPGPRPAAPRSFRHSARRSRCVRPGPSFHSESTGSGQDFPGAHRRQHRGRLGQCQLVHQDG